MAPRPLARSSDSHGPSLFPEESIILNCTDDLAIEATELDSTAVVVCVEAFGGDEAEDTTGCERAGEEGGEVEEEIEEDR